jgi:PPOX class probable F420-dependent enzyme
MSKLTDKEKQILNGQNFVFIATVNPDGSPQVSPVWAETQEDTICINTSINRIKARNMARDPRVALSVYDKKDPYDEIAIRGHVTEMTQEGAEEHINKLSFKYLGKPYPWSHDAKHRIIIKIEKT